MKKWSWVLLVALVALLAIGYSLTAKRTPPASEAQLEHEIGVEEYETDGTDLSAEPDGYAEADAGEMAARPAGEAADEAEGTVEVTAPEPGTAP